MGIADELFAGFDAAPTILEEPAKNYICKQTMTDGIGCTLIKFRADGLTLEQWE